MAGLKHAASQAVGAEPRWGPAPSIMYIRAC
jgi:hypothetical protein